MAKVYAPFTEEQVKALKEWQSNPAVHPFTCCSHDGCERSKREDQGVLIPSKLGWTCPCGKWKQYWAHDFMIERGPEDTDEEGPDPIDTDEL